MNLLLKSHATRWNHFTVSGPWNLIRRLFHNIDDPFHLDTLEISIIPIGHAALESEPVQLPQPLSPKGHWGVTGK